MVFKSGLPITMRARRDPEAQVMDEDIERVRAIPNQVAQCGTAARLLHDSSSGSQVGICWRTAHDPVPSPGCWHPPCSWVECRVDIETCGTHTLGMTVVDRYDLTGRPANALGAAGAGQGRFHRTAGTKRLQTFA